MSADFWAGYVSGAVGIIIGNPLDLVKTRLQAGPKPAADTSTSTSTAITAGPRSFRGQFENAGTLVRGRSITSTHCEILKGNSKLISHTQHRRNSTYSRLWRTQRAPLHDLQSYAHAPWRFSRCAELVCQSLPCWCDGRVRVFRCLCTDGAHQVPRTSVDGQTRDVVVDSEADMDEGWAERFVLWGRNHKSARCSRIRVLVSSTAILA